PVALLIGGRIAGIPLATLLSAHYTPLCARYAASLLALLALWLAVTLLVRFALRLPLARRLFVHRVLVVGPDAAALRAQLTPLAADRFAFSDAADPPTGRPWAVLLATPQEAGAITPALRAYRQQGARIFDRAGFAEHCLGRVDLDLLTEAWFLSGDGFAETRLQAAARRGLDLSVSLILLVLTFPLMLAVALAISFDSAGPVLYRQERVGRHGIPFTLFKFRSMRADAEKGGAPRWATLGDSRVTRIGRIIRATRIDELPQLVNVLRGEMSLVGPRPERPHFVEQLAEVIPFYRERSLVKPGVTGWAQVNYPYGASVEDAREKLAYDLYYIKHRSLLLDLLVLLSTVRVVLLREGAR
ncbi:MAG: exopolysaccharide biosynthesis polyprenyl glycosylphosphotransferase, partial [Acetobacteraceae bacterium]